MNNLLTQVFIAGLAAVVIFLLTLISRMRILFIMSTGLYKLFRVFMGLVALHSFCVGLALIIIPLEYFSLFGYEGYQGTFFKIQGGVFHIVMCGAYIPAALDPRKYIILVRFSVFAKFIATVFLLSYVLFSEMVWMVLLSGIMDFIMGLILLWFCTRPGLLREGPTA
jgi:hypothetical protein